MMYIPRSALSLLQKYAEFFPAVVCTGARQVGKTTLLHETFPDYTYVSLDLPTRAAMAEETPDAFLKEYPPPVLIDEIQYAPGFFRHLKAVIDEDRHHMGRFLLTGSQKFPLMHGLSDSLAGRVAIVDLESLSWRECAAVDRYDLTTFVHRGGFPELARVPDMDRDVFMAGYVATYLERDVRQLLNVGSLRDFERFIRLLATRTGQQLDLTAAGRAIGITTKTAAAWVSVLETSRQITLLEPYFGNLGKRLVKTPKLYFNDTGLLCWLLGVDGTNIERSPFRGAIYETLVYAEVRKSIQRQARNRRVYYYRDRTGTEVDFLILGNGAHLVEVKLTEHARIDDAKGLKRLTETVRKTTAETAAAPELDPIRHTIICRTPNDYVLPTGAFDISVTNLAGVDSVVR